MWLTCPRLAERRAELTSLKPPRRALGCVHQPGGLRDLYVGPGMAIRRPGVRTQHTRKVAHYGRLVMSDIVLAVLVVF